jgi:hypothetical protein
MVTTTRSANRPLRLREFEVLGAKRVAVSTSHIGRSPLALLDNLLLHVIPSPIDQNRCAQSRNPIDIMVLIQTMRPTRRNAEALVVLRRAPLEPRRRAGVEASSFLATIPARFPCLGSLNPPSRNRH